MNKSDIFRYIHWPLDKLNKHMPALVVPGWRLGPDESMSAWTGEECPARLCGTSHQSERAILISHFVERKPELMDLEIKTTADGHSLIAVPSCWARFLHLPESTATSSSSRGIKGLRKR
eukprot:6185902-Pleurochrysis_carterae.AAC.2